MTTFEKPIQDSQLPDVSAFVLAQDALQRGPENDGLMMPDDIVRLQIDADLVTLGACSTRGSHVDGSGYFGLTEAFLQAGARSLPSGGHPYRNPAYWSAFILVGDPG